MMNNKGHTLTEILIAIAISAILIASTIGAFMMAKAIYAKSMAEYALQRDVNRLMNRIIRGAREQGGTFGLRSARSFTIPSITDLDYNSTDGNAMSYYLNGNSIIYQRTTPPPNQQVLQATVYTAPAGANITLRFWEPAGYSDHETVGIYLSVSQNVGSRTVSGSLSTYVNIRNIPK